MSHAERDADALLDDESLRDELAHDLSLALMYLSSWIEPGNAEPRFWKGFEFRVLNQLEDEGLISGRRQAKSAYLTHEGVARARALLVRYAPPRPPAESTREP